MVDSYGTCNPWFKLLTDIGSYESVLLRPDAVFVEDARGIHVHDIGDCGTVVCPNGGVVEPITLAIQMGFYRIPHQMLEFCRTVVESNNVYLAYRILSAACSVQGSVDKEVAFSGGEARKLLYPVAQMDVEERCRQAVQTRNPSEAGPSIGRKIRRNQMCPCGSGLKYKKCCGK